MGNQLGQFGGERFFGQANGFIEPGLHPLALLLQGGLEILQKIRPPIPFRGVDLQAGVTVRDFRHEPLCLAGLCGSGLPSKRRQDFRAPAAD